MRSWRSLVDLWIWSWPCNYCASKIATGLFHKDLVQKLKRDSGSRWWFEGACIFHCVEWCVSNDIVWKGFVWRRDKLFCMSFVKRFSARCRRKNWGFRASRGLVGDSRCQKWIALDEIYPQLNFQPISPYFLCQASSRSGVAFQLFYQVLVEECSTRSHFLVRFFARPEASNFRGPKIASVSGMVLVI